MWIYSLKKQGPTGLKLSSENGTNLTVTYLGGPHASNFSSYCKTWSGVEWICKTWICKRWICKRWICKTWISKRWICKTMVKHDNLKLKRATRKVRIFFFAQIKSKTLPGTISGKNVTVLKENGMLSCIAANKF